MITALRKALDASTMPAFTATDAKHRQFQEFTGTINKGRPGAYAVGQYYAHEEAHAED
jgi:hypothetical protein